METFFGVGAGRCGSMALANYLNNETQITCLHEGKYRYGTTSGEQVLPYLTLQNYATYKNPQQAGEIIATTRGETMEEKARQLGTPWFGDIAYFYAPFVSALRQVHPTAKLLVLIRDGRSFVRSVYTDSVPDPTPVGWPDDRPLVGVEKFIALGRLRPLPTDPLHAKWSALSGIEKNAWLWNETYRLIFDALTHWPEDRYMVIRFEEFFADLPESYQKVRRFLGIDDAIPEPVAEAMRQRINQRSRYLLPPPERWTTDQTDAFLTYAEPMMRRLDYL
ncbi:sulfotransferase domain-containing protein [Roseospirillum parvum]|uniref:Sulfotransferase domain-containing protein n=1 Tax=Roseospirillum parvum TaxID=83401 RepID=A0A1G7V1L1_9PROT|nr:sulfotransferase domain-containing protein [Roseospirillum parvum]SDG52850.1 Sulfotransferase domain-containing protein [Roseospirillum parvum]